MELDHLKLSLSLSTRKAIDVEEKLKNKELQYVILFEEKNELQSLLILKEKQKKSEGEIFENKITESMTKIAEQNMKIKERSFQEYKESCATGIQALQERILNLDSTLKLAERESDVLRMLVSLFFVVLI